MVGDVVRPGAYQMSAAGTVLTALYSGGGPTANGSLRKIEVRRGGQAGGLSSTSTTTCCTASTPATSGSQSGDVVFVPVHGGLIKVAGEVTRPAIYELLPGETLRDLIEYAGGFGPAAYQARVRIHRILPAESRGVPSRARVVVDVGPDQLAGGVVPAVPMAPGDSVTVLSVAERVRGYVTVKGNVWVEGQVGFTPGMKLSDAIQVAGGPKPDVYLDRILISRTNDDSTKVQLRSAFADSTGRVTDDLVLQDDDEIRIFSRATFLNAPYVTIVGAVRKPGRVAYRAGMTMRDVVLLANGVTEDADLNEAEIARRGGNDPGALAQTIRVPLDSTYLQASRSNGPGGDGATRCRSDGIPDLALQPYDNVLITRQAGWEMQRLVYLTGQVKHPGRYALQTKTERVSDLIERAGGLTEQAYPGGVQFYRSYSPGRRPADPRPAQIADDAKTQRDTVPAGYIERVGIDLPQVLKTRSSGTTSSLPAGTRFTFPSSTRSSWSTAPSTRPGRWRTPRVNRWTGTSTQLVATPSWVTRATPMSPSPMGSGKG